MSAVAPYAADGFCGLIVPYGNFTAEYEARFALPPGFLAIAARLLEEGGDIEARLRCYFDEAKLDAAVRSFGSTPLKAIAIACSSSSYLIGRAREEALFAALAARHGDRFSWTTDAVSRVLAQFGTMRFALLSPYPPRLTRACTAYWESRGYTVDEVEELPGGTGFHPIYTIGPAAAVAALRRLRARTQAPILITGTGLATLQAQAALAAEPGPLFFSANLALFWHAARIAGLPEGALPFFDWLKPEAAWRRRFLASHPEA